MTKKKILVVASWYPSDENAVTGVFIEEQAAALSKEYDVAVVVPDMASWRDALRGPKSKEEVRAGLTVFREWALPPVPRGPDRVGYYAYVRAVERGFRKFTKTRGLPDVIHAHVVLPGGWAALKVGERHKVPVVLTEYSGPFSMHLGTENSRRLVRETLARADSVVALSPALRDQMLDFHPAARIEIIGALVRTDFFAPGACERNGDRATHFLATARLSPEKGIDHLIRAAKLLVERGVTAFDVTIGGDGPERARLEELVATLGVGKWCRFLGALDRAGVRAAMQRCDAFVLPSLGETFGIVVGEAMACGKPVIATRCGGPEFIVDENSGVLVEKASAESLADAMAEFVAGRVKFDPARVRESVVGRFGEGAFLRNISEIYERVGARN